MQQTFEYLDLESFRQVYNYLHDPLKMKFYVEGIKCSKCIAKIEQLRFQNEQVQNLEVDLAHQTALVELKNPSDSFARIADDLARLGFKPVPIQFQHDATAEWKKESKQDVIRLAVAGFCAGNIMMLSFAIYFGLSGKLKQQLEWLQLLLYIPVVSFVAVPFYRGFIQGLKSREISIDGPMAIASFLGFAISTWNLVRGTGSIYFDSTSGFLFLILATRFFQKKARNNYLKFLKPSALLEGLKARVISSETSGKPTWTWARADQLQPGQKILVLKGDWLPADGVLLYQKATFDLSVLDGETLPRLLHPGFVTKAGYRLLSESAQIEVTKVGAQSFLGRLLHSIHSGSISDTEASALSNKASKILLSFVLGLACLVAGWGFFGNFEAQFEKALALIVLACPCAMAFGTPLAFAFSMKRAQDKGIIVKSPKSFEDLFNIETIFLDKTGTLTEKILGITNSSLTPMPTLYKQIILALEAASEHPVAYTLRENWKDIYLPKNFKVENIQEIPSLGVQGTHEGTFYEFKHFIKDREKWFGLFGDGFLLLSFQLQPLLLQDTKKTIDELKNKKFKISLLSGDSALATQNTALTLDISPIMAHPELTPEAKEKIVSSTPRSLMIGDGVNDALALQAATVGIAVKGSIDVAINKSDILFLKDGIYLLPELLQIAEKARRQIRRNLTAALVYNTLGGIAAISGYINPFVAALLMPISSIFILISTWWGTRQ